MDKIYTTEYTIAGIGELLWDILPESRRVGGAPANFAIHSGSLGAKAHIISAVGNDRDGSDILEALVEKTADVRHIGRTPHPTGRVTVALDRQGHPSYTIKKNAAWDFIELSRETELLAEKCDAVCFGSLAQRNPVSQKAIHSFLAQTSKDCLRVFDINLRQNFFSDSIIERSLEAANVLKLNNEELIVLKRLLELPESDAAALRVLLDRYDLKYIACTQGSRGSIMMDRNASVSSPGAISAISDTIGAGDSFTAAMVMGILQGWPLDTINRMAEKVAAFVCSQPGATPELPPHLLSEINNALPLSSNEFPSTTLIPSPPGALQKELSAS